MSTLMQKMTLLRVAVLLLAREILVIATMSANYSLSTLTAKTAVAPVITIPLDKQHVPVVRNGATVAHKTAYVGTVYFGVPDRQPYTVLFDTGSGHVFLPSKECTSEVCLKHRRFDAASSPSAVDINYEGDPVNESEGSRDEVSVVYGTGEIFGGFARETVCLTEKSFGGAPSDSEDPGCVQVRVVLATEMSEEPFGSFSFDGVMGLGLGSLSLDPEFNFFGQLAQADKLAEARFGYFLSNSDLVPSEISFGGHDPRRVASDLQWASVHRPDLGYWQVRINSVTVDGRPLEVCQDGGCTAIADTGTSLLGVPKRALRNLHMKLARPVSGDPEDLDCKNFKGPDIVFDIGDGVRVALGPEDYSRSAAMRVLQNSTNKTQVLCRASLMPVEADPDLGSSAWIFGEPVLRKYYTAYDWRAQKVGFAVAAQPQRRDDYAQATPSVLPTLQI